MPADSTPMRWDVFCNVIDNFGDIGVCWRLARQLSSEYGFAVRLWVDDLAAFAPLCPALRPGRAQQVVDNIHIHHWHGSLAGVTPGDVVVEAFACRLPDEFEHAMAARTVPPIWINLDYLSAEEWVVGCHALPSPHPRLPLTKYFFFPGFGPRTGGLLREQDLELKRRRFVASPDARRVLFESLGVLPPKPETLVVSLFSYENAALPALLEAWTEGGQAILCLAPATRNLPALQAFSGGALGVGAQVCRGALHLQIVPFVAQPDFDLTLWASDLNFVRGEDSFVRAQWAARPMVWHIYPQADNAHRVKLDAFLDVYCADLPKESAEVLRDTHLAWNGARTMTQALWGRLLAVLPALRAHAGQWQKQLLKQEDLCSRLVHFCRSKL